MKPGRWLVAGFLVLPAGCAYYNGMYNANRLANQAEKAERDGRRFDAQSYWAQAEVKADSVISRHSTSGWVDDALLIKSKALIIRGSCLDAIPYLERVRFSSPDPDLVEESNFLLGACYAELGDPEGVIRHVETVTTSTDVERRIAALTLYGTALNRVGRYQDASEVFAELDASALDGERAMALAGAGFLGAAVDLADSLLARRDTFVVWDSVLAVVAVYDLATASELTDQLAAQDSILPERRAQYYLNDGQRWAPVDPTRAIDRFKQAAADTAAHQYGGTARIEWAWAELGQATTTADLVAVLPILEAATTSGGTDGLLARRLAATIQRVQSISDTLGPTSPNGDLEVFLLAETARDSLGAPVLARVFFQRLTQDWPQSPYAPKALLAMAVLDADHADVYRQYLLYVYPDSPYLNFLAGEASVDLGSLEDSLQAYAFSKVAKQGQTERRGQGRQRRLRGDVDELNPQNDP